MGGRDRRTRRHRSSSAVVSGLYKTLTPNKQSDVVGHTCNPSSTWETEAVGSLGVQGQLGLHREFQVTQCYLVRPCLKTRKTQEAPVARKHCTSTARKKCKSGPSTCYMPRRAEKKAQRVTSVLDGPFPLRTVFTLGPQVGLLKLSIEMSRAAP